MSLTKRPTRLFALIVVVVAHFAMLPIAIGLTVWHNDPSGMPLRNEMAWVSVPSAQMVLATLFLAFGAGRLVFRFTVTVVALVLILLSMGWAYAVLGVFENPWAGLPELSVHALVPAILSGFVLSLLRPWVGTAHWIDRTDDVRHSILDLLLTSFLVSVTLSWHRYAVSRFDGQTPEFWTIAITSGISALSSVSCLLLVMGRNRLHSLIGTAGLVTQFAVILSLNHGSYWFDLISPWVIVIFTLAIFRFFGVRLRLSQLAILTDDSSAQAITRKIAT